RSTIDIFGQLLFPAAAEATDDAERSSCEGSEFHQLVKAMKMRSLIKEACA
ncbi:hypothetical protein Pmar_PMAR007368, partial [Perkinsus marinus ATCC 50983]